MRSKFPTSIILFLVAMTSGAGVLVAGNMPLVKVSISPESRVKAEEGGALHELVQGEWCDFGIVIDNSAGITAALEIESANLIPTAPAKPTREQWLQAELVPPGPLTGARGETRKLRLRTDHRGMRAAVLHVNAGQGTQDLAFRSDVLLNFKIAAGKSADLTDEGWWAGAINVDWDPAEAAALMKSGGYHIAQVNTWTNDQTAWADRTPPADPVVATADGRFYHLLAGKDERGGGALLMSGLKAPFPLAGYPEKTREWPPSVFFLEMAKRRGARLDAGTADAWDLPFWLASGKLDSIGIGSSSEGLGYPRDLGKFPGIEGAARWSQELYFRALNCGLRLPPSFSKIHVHLGDKLDWQGWWDGFKAGKVVVSNGPLLRLTANGILPGQILKTDKGPLQLLLAGKLESQEPIRSVELIRNGVAEVIELPALVTINESGWFAVRAIAGRNDTFRFAMTAPWYVEIGGEAMQPRKQDAEFFLDWTRRRIELVRNALSDPEKQKSSFATLAGAESFWRDKVGSVQPLTRVSGRIFDAETKEAMPARIYIQNDEGAWFFPTSESGSAVRYERRNYNNLFSSENHTTLSAGPWLAELRPGRYTITVERGKEWRPLHREIVLGDEAVDLELPLERWVNMAAAGWFSGETHVHRTLADLPNVMLAEDLNVAFPISFWCLDGSEIPRHFDKGVDPNKLGETIEVDATHVIWPCNTEWEIFGINGYPHTLGAILALGHRTPFKTGGPPLGPISKAAREQGALLDMDKPDWPWALALPPAMGIHLFELSNNHIWRAPFALKKWTTAAPAWMLPNARIQGDERDWIEYTHQTYWALLNGGQRLRPSAGTASGVHPVPLGYSRVYVHCPDGFSYQNWRAGLEAGRSFVTTGPICISEITRQGNSAHLQAKLHGEQPLGKVEIIVNGLVYQTIQLNSREFTLDREIPLDGTTWIALRVWEPQPGGRLRFAHTAPVWFDDPQKPLRPRPEQAEFLAQRVRDEISRSTPVLPAAAILEYEQALHHWESLTATPQ